MSAPAATHEALPSLWQETNFVRLWVTRVCGQTASQMLMVALGWQMYELTGQAWDLGLVGLAQFLPALLFTLPGGQAADRYHRGRILIVTTSGMLTISTVLAVASASGHVTATLILGLSIAIGVLRAFQMPALQSLATQVVPPILLPRAIAANASGMQVAIISGPALGGFVYAAGAWIDYAVCSVLFTAAALQCLGVRVSAPVAPARRPGWGELLAGLHFIRRRPVLLGAMSLDLFAVLLGGATALLPIYAKDILHTGPWGLGLLRASPPVGALITSLWLVRRPIRRRAGRILFAGVSLFGLSMMAFAMSRSLVLSMAILAVSGAADMVSVVIRSSWVQLDTPDEMRGRVNAVNSVFIGASNQLGEFESGATAAVIGPVGSVLLGGIGTVLVAALWIRWFPSLWQREHLRAATDGLPN